MPHAAVEPLGLRRKQRERRGTPLCSCPTDGEAVERRLLELRATLEVERMHEWSLATPNGTAFETSRRDGRAAGLGVINGNSERLDEFVRLYATGALNT